MRASLLFRTRHTQATHDAYVSDKAHNPMNIPNALVNVILLRVAQMRAVSWRLVHRDLLGMGAVHRDIRSSDIFLTDTSPDNPHAFSYLVDYVRAERLPRLIAFPWP